MLLLNKIYELDSRTNRSLAGTPCMAFQLIKEYYYFFFNNDIMHFLT